MAQRNVERFRGELVFNAQILLYHSTLGFRVIKKPSPGGRGPLPSEVGTTEKVRRTFVCEQKPGSRLDCPVHTIFARRLHSESETLNVPTLNPTPETSEVAHFGTLNPRQNPEPHTLTIL